MGSEIGITVWLRASRSDSDLKVCDLGLKLNAPLSGSDGKVRVRETEREREWERECDFA